MAAAMSRRVNRRQQRQQDELDELQALSESQGEPQLEKKDPPSTNMMSSFSALELDEPEEPAVDHENADIKATSSFGDISPNNSKKTNKSKKMKKKGPKAQEPASTNVDDMSLEQMSALLATAPKQPKKTTLAHDDGKDHDAVPFTDDPSSASKTPFFVLRAQLCLDASHMDPANELRRQFGAAAIKASERERGGSLPSRAGSRSRENRGANLNSNMRVRTVLCTPKPTWPDLNRSFVGMSMTTDEMPGGARVCNWVHSRAYKQAQFQFTQAVSSYDTQSLVALMRVFPWHVDTLLQLSAVSRYQGDLGQAGDFLDRALFAMERSAVPTFVSGLTSSSGPPMCDFQRAENRAFWLAVHRNIDLFGRRGTWRTSLEWCKLLFALDMTDPHGILLWIDFLAIKSRQLDWFLAFIDALDAYRNADELAVETPSSLSLDKLKSAAHDTTQGSLDWSVGLSFARALALRGIKVPSSDAALSLAIVRHPRAAILLADKLDVGVPAEVVRAYPMRGTYSSSDPAFDELLSHIYVHRSLNLWKEAANLNWFRARAAESWSVLMDISKTNGPAMQKFAQADGTIRMGVYRHIVVADVPEALHQQLVRYLPPDVRNPPGGMDTFDPLPPQNGTRFDESYFGVIPGMTQRASHTGLWELLQRLQNLGVHDVAQLLEHVDDRTRDLLLQVMDPAVAGGVRPSEDDDVDSHDDEAEAAGESDIYNDRATEGGDDSDHGHELDHQHVSAESQTSAHSQSEPSLLQRAWNALWGA